MRRADQSAESGPPRARTTLARPVCEHHDPVDGIVHSIPIVLPLVGGVLMFLLAFIAIYMA